MTEQLKLLMDYTIFQIGLYATLCTLLIAILGVGPWKEHSAHMSYYLLRACLKSPHPSPTAAFRIRQPPFNPRTGDDPICPFSDTHRGHQKRGREGRFLPFSQGARAGFRTDVWPSLRRWDCSHDFVAPEQVAMLGNSNGWLCGVKNLTLDTPPGPI